MRFLALLLVCVSLSVLAAAPQPPAVIGKAWMVGDLSSGQLLASQKSDERFEPASLTKLMTAYVVFIALREKKLSLEQQCTSRRAPGRRRARACSSIRAVRLPWMS